MLGAESRMVTFYSLDVFGRALFIKSRLTLNPSTLTENERKLYVSFEVMGSLTNRLCKK